MNKQMNDTETPQIGVTILLEFADVSMRPRVVPSVVLEGTLVGVVSFAVGIGVSKMFMYIDIN